jgi:CSLREA domain-containing protein
MKPATIAAAVMAVLGAATVRAATITVTSLADDTVANGQVTLREAILAANKDSSVDGSEPGNGADRIVFAMRTGVIVLNGTRLPMVSDDLTLAGPDAALLAIDGAQESQLLEVDFGVSVTVTGLTLRGGRMFGGDGGAIVSRGTLTLDGCVLSDNAADNGGAVWNSSQLTIDESTLAGNSALDGGAIYNTGTLEVSGSTFRGNFTGGVAPFVGGGNTGNGGAVWNSALLIIDESTLAENSALNGGAIYNTGTLEVSGSTFRGNFTGGVAPLVGGGGAIHNAGLADVTISTLVGNFAGNGGAIAGVGYLGVRNSTLTGNHAVNSGGGISNSVNPVELRASVVAENIADGAPQDVAAAVLDFSTDNVIGVDTGLTGISHGSNGNQIGTAANPLEPLLGPLQDNGGSTATRAVLPGSPALDAAAACDGLDQRRIGRPLDGDGDTVARCDVGAYETYRLPAGPASFFAIPPCRMYDTRAGGAPPLAANASHNFVLAITCKVPVTARALALNVTAVGPTHDGNLRLYPAGTEAPLASALNFAAGRARANNMLLPLGVTSLVTVRVDMPAGSPGSVHLVLDVFGYLE